MATEALPSLFSLIHLPLLSCSPTGTLLEANHAFRAMISHRPDDALPGMVTGLFRPEDHNALLYTIDKAMYGREPPALCIPLLVAGGQAIPVRLRAVTPPAVPGEQPRILLSVEALVTDQGAEASLSHQMLRDLNHRLKNSLGLILAILQMDLMRGHAAVDIKTTIIRIHAISRVYDRLYLQDLSDRMKLDQYAQDLFESLVLGLAGPGHELELFCTTTPLEVSGKEAINLGLIMTELLGNALRHGFPREWKGELGLDLSEHEDCACIRVWNRGQTDLPPDFDMAASSRTGLLIVHHLCHQAKGEVHVHPSPPTFTVTVPLNR